MSDNSGYGVITGSNIDRFRAKVVLAAINVYLKHGIKVNRLYTPTNMRTVASQYTGKRYAKSRKGLEQAAADLQEIVDLKGNQ